MLPFVEAMFCVPVETACVERGFSEHRVIKHRLTNRLRVVMVDSLMRVSILAGSVESFDYAAAKEFHSRPVGELLVNKLFATMARQSEEGAGFSGQGGREASGAAVKCVSVAEKFACQVALCSGCGECDLAMSSRQHCNNEGLDASLWLTAACEVEAGADAGADARAEPEAGAEADAAAAGATAVADVLRELAAAVVRTGAACCLG
ncbi:unnamed protein product [Sphagnum troendelagicum]|uniref:HAT C-terminal dimerisation domain-containing protein n=1 Tax=Sphagnum troendelagicum TaxID=128251 RepID=A0ABP0TLN6_9BRYO